jgi:polyhydroxyalkanoate synthesis regulator phasin
MKIYNKILPIDPLVNDNFDEDIDQKLHNMLVNGNITDYLNLVNDLKSKKNIEQSVYIPNEIPKDISNIRDKNKKILINTIFENINRLEETLHKFKNLSKK